MGDFVEVTTIPDHGLHHKGEFYSEPGEEFSFHPWLASKIRSSIGREDVTLRLEEISCEDANCPITETKVTAFVPESDQPVSLFRFGRRKEQINKLDIRLSLDRKLDFL